MDIDRTVFRSTNGNYRMQALFLERQYKEPDKTHCIYTLGKEHRISAQGNYTYSIYQLYLEEEDVTEYEFACKYFADYTHWKRICNCEWFKPFLAEMRESLTLKLKARAIRGIANIAGDGTSKSQLQALRYLADKGYIDAKAKGRPSKEEVDAVAKELADERERLEDEFNRVIN